jgi:aminoglycoside 6-adenylyltransferase
MSRAYEKLTDNFVSWARSRPDIRAAIVIGSRARTERPADEWSDLDILVFVEDPGPYLADGAWLSNVGKPYLTFTEGTPGGGMRERRALFKGGLDVDFAMLPCRTARALRRWLLLRSRAPFLQRLLPSRAAERARREIALFADINRRGTRILFDKDGIGACLPLLRAEAPAPSLPAVNVFLNAVNDFWFHSVWTAKKLRRGEVWTAKGCCDGYMKGILQRMMEWHAWAVHGADYDTWHRGRFLEQWADPRAVAGLGRAYARYEAADVWRALGATMELFRWLSAETAGKWGIALPAEGADYAAALVQRLFDESG